MVVTLLIKKNQTIINDYGLRSKRTALKGHESICATLLSHGAHIDCQDAQEETPLLLAVELKQFALAKTLVSLGADIRCKNKKGANALHLLSEMGEYELVQELIKLRRAFDAPKEVIATTSCGL